MDLFVNKVSAQNCTLEWLAVPQVKKQGGRRRSLIFEGKTLYLKRLRLQRCARIDRKNKVSVFAKLVSRISTEIEPSRSNDSRPLAVFSSLHHYYYHCSWFIAFRLCCLFTLPRCFSIIDLVHRLIANVGGRKVEMEKKVFSIFLSQMVVEK